MAKNLIQCPKCWGSGVKQTLAQVVGSGTISIRRAGHPDRGSNGKYFDETIIVGRNFDIICGNCQTVVYYHEGSVNYGF